MIADRSNPVRTVSRTKWATCPEGTKSWIDGGSSQTWSTSQARNVLLIPRLNHDAPSSSRKIRLLGQAPSTPRTTASEFLITVNRIQISLMIRAPFVARAFRAAKDDGLAPQPRHCRSAVRAQWRRRRARSRDGGLNDDNRKTHVSARRLGTASLPYECRWCRRQWHRSVTGDYFAHAGRSRARPDPCGDQTAPDSCKGLRSGSEASRSLQGFWDADGGRGSPRQRTQRSRRLSLFGTRPWRLRADRSGPSARRPRYGRTRPSRHRHRAG